MPRRRRRREGDEWRWITEDDYYRQFYGWLRTREYGEQVEFEAGLAMVVRQGPEGHTYNAGEDVYCVYACCGRLVMWLMVGVAWPGKRDMLPLVWGTALDGNHIERSAGKAVKLLRKWREQHGA